MFNAERFNKPLDQYRDAASRTIEADPVATVELAARRFELNDTERSSVFQHLIRGGDLSQWGRANAVTRVSQDVESYDRATELEALGGKVIELTPSDWHALAA